MSLALVGLSGVEFVSRRGVRVADGGGLENRCYRKVTVGSNPTPSATPSWISIPTQAALGLSAA